MPLSPLQKLLEEKKPQILALADEYGVEDIKLFGSVARGEDTEDSDIDFLITVGDEEKFYLLEFWNKLEEMVGRKIDVIREKCLFWAVKPSVLADAKPL